LRKLPEKIVFQNPRGFLRFGSPQSGILICGVFLQAPQGVETAIVIGAQNALLVARCQQLMTGQPTNPPCQKQPGSLMIRAL